MMLTRHAIFLAVAVLLCAAPTWVRPAWGQEPVSWGPWQSLRACHGVLWEFRLSKSPRHEYVAYRVTNNTQEKVAAMATARVRRTDGSWTGEKTLPCGTLPLGGYEGWVAPGKTIDLGSVNVASPNPHPITGDRETADAVETSLAWVFPEPLYKQKVAQTPSTAYLSGLTDGHACREKLEVRVGWQSVVVKTKDKNGKPLPVLEQTVCPGKNPAELVVAIRVCTEGATSTVDGSVPLREINNVQLASEDAFTYGFGKYWCVTVDCGREDAFRLAMDRGDQNTDSRAILYFTRKEDALIAVERVGEAIREAKASSKQAQDAKTR